jgi:hypothetical protein
MRESHIGGVIEQAGKQFQLARLQGLITLFRLFNSKDGKMLKVLCVKVSGTIASPALGAAGVSPPSLCGWLAASDWLATCSSRRCGYENDTRHPVNGTDVGDKVCSVTVYVLEVQAGSTADMLAHGVSCIDQQNGMT